MKLSGLAAALSEGRWPKLETLHIQNNALSEAAKASLKRLSAAGEARGVKVNA